MGQVGPTPSNVREQCFSQHRASFALVIWRSWFRASELGAVVERSKLLMWLTRTPTNQEVAGNRVARRGNAIFGWVVPHSGRHVVETLDLSCRIDLQPFCVLLLHRLRLQVFFRNEPCNCAFQISPGSVLQNLATFGFLTFWTVKSGQSGVQLSASSTQNSKSSAENGGGAPKVSLCSHWRLLVELWWCFLVFF